MYIYFMNSKLFRGSLDTIIIKLLTENKELYGYQITQMVKELTNGEFAITEGSLYPSLHKLEGKEILESNTKQVGNRLRKYYKLTEAGKKESKDVLSEMESFIQNLQNILHHKLA